MSVKTDKKTPIRKKKPTKRAITSRTRLSTQQITFCYEYVARKKSNQGLAAIAAGYSKKGAHVIGNKLMKLKNVQKKIDQLTERLLKPQLITAQRLVDELALIAFYGLKDIKQGSPVNTCDKIKAIDEIGKFQGAFTEKVEVTHIETDHQQDLKLAELADLLLE